MRRPGGVAVVNTGRSIDQDHLAPSRRRGTAVAQPSRAARRSALSTGIRVSARVDRRKAAAISSTESSPKT